MFIKTSPKRITIKGYKRDDCTCTALGNSLGISYDLARKILQTGNYINGKFSFVKSKPKTKAQFMLKTHVERICEALSTQRKCYNVNSHQGGTRKHITTVEQFAESNPKGTYIILTKSHLVSVIDGKILDAWDSSRLPVEISYKIVLTKARNTIKELAEFYKMNSSEHIIKNHKQKILKNI